MYSMRDTGGQHLKENTEWTRGGGNTYTLKNE